MPKDYAYTDLALHGRFTDEGNYFRLYVLLNGVEVPVQVLSVADYRERFEKAAAKGSRPSEQQSY